MTETPMEQLERENWALKQALGYPIPADKETIDNPFRCGVCDALSASAPETPEQVRKLTEALENIALLDEADGHGLTWEHASRAVAIAASVLGKHPATIHAERSAALSSRAPQAGGEGRCLDCGLPYEDHGFQDLVVQPSAWNEMCPEDGLLCPTCMCRRAHKLNMQNVKAEFRSGPFVSTPADAPKGDVRGALTALRNRLAMTSDEHWSAEDSRLARNVWLLSPSQDEGEALHEWIVRESERQQLYAATEALRRALEEIANYVPPEDPDKDPYTQIAGFAKRRAREALSRSPEPRCLVTGNPVGTDTWQANNPCQCLNCQAMLAAYSGDPEALQDAIELERRGRSE